MKYLGALCLLLVAVNPAHADQFSDIMGGSGGQHLVTVRFQDPRTANFLLRLDIRSVVEEVYADGGTGNSDDSQTYGYIFLKDGNLSYWGGTFRPKAGGWDSWLFFNPKFRGDTLTFWARGFADYKTDFNYPPGYYVRSMTTYWHYDRWSGVEIPQDATVSFSHVSSIPEAATWSMLITGFGVIGAAVRQRRVAIA